MQIVDNWLNFNALNEIDLQRVKHRECRVLESCLLPLHVTKSAVKHLKISLNDQKKKKQVATKNENQRRKLIYTVAFSFSQLCILSKTQLITGYFFPESSWDFRWSI